MIFVVLRPNCEKSQTISKFSLTYHIYKVRCSKAFVSLVTWFKNLQNQPAFTCILNSIFAKLLCCQYIVNHPLLYSELILVTYCLYVNFPPFRNQLSHTCVNLVMVQFWAPTSTFWTRVAWLVSSSAEVTYCFNFSVRLRQAPRTLGVSLTVVCRPAYIRVFNSSITSVRLRATYVR